MDINKESKYFKKYIYNGKYGYFASLIHKFIGSFRYRDDWEKEIFPLLYSLRDRTGKIDDWWGGMWNKICFRYEYVLIEDNDLHQVGRKFPPILDENGEPMLNEENERLADTEYLLTHYPELIKIPLDEFITICEKWYEILDID